MQILERPPRSSKPKLKRIARTIPISSQLSPPAVRTVFVEASQLGTAEAPDVVVSIHPVVSLESRIEDHYEMIVEENTAAEHVQSMSAEDMLARGFRRGARQIEHGAIVVIDDIGGIISTIDLPSWKSANSAYRIVPCPWPAELDEVRLARIIGELKADAAAWNAETAF